MGEPLKKQNKQTKNGKNFHKTSSFINFISAVIINKY